MVFAMPQKPRNSIQRYEHFSVFKIIETEETIHQLLGVICRALCLNMYIYYKPSSNHTYFADITYTLSNFEIRYDVTSGRLHISGELHKIYFGIFLKVPGPIASNFFQTSGDFGIRREVIFFSLLLVNFTAVKCTVWMILMKM